MEKAKRILACGLVVFSGTLSILLLKELSTDAVAMLIGVACGLAVSLPLGIGLVVWAGRSGQSKPEQTVERSQQPAAPVIIVSPGGAQPLPGAWPGAVPWSTGSRHFESQAAAGLRILGEGGPEAGPGTLFDQPGFFSGS